MAFNPDPNPGPTNPLPPGPPSGTTNDGSGGPPVNPPSNPPPSGTQGEMDDLEARLKALQGM